MLLLLLLHVLLQLLPAGEESRTKSAALLVSRLLEISNGTPLMVAVDLNAGARQQQQPSFHAVHTTQRTAAAPCCSDACSGDH